MTDALANMGSQREILPATGAFVVFTIDPLASVDPRILEDPDAVLACKNLVSKQYVALAAEREDFYQPWEPYNSTTIEFILQGEPKSSAERCMEPSMSVPIVPMTNDAHPSSRLPLRPSNPFPWKDCYVSCFFVETVRSPTLYTEAPIDCILDLDELDRHDRFLGTDVERAKVLRRGKAAAEIKAPIEASPSTTGQAPTSAKIQRPSTSEAPISPTNLGTMEDHNDGLHSKDNAAIRSQHESPPIVTVNFSHDLSIVTEINDPADYYKEVEAIARIQQEAWPRIADAKARAIKAAAEMNAELYDGKTLDLLVARPTKGRVARIVLKSKKKGKSLARQLFCWVHPAHRTS
ncbi:hypothetical protein C8R43DRAFT_1235640 [Mycena crocata]|nr:hypothetical protein C8R43DRAFT_1235640 [Mycena crocata]